ncbi:unnamed protein product [Pedinophyceae sp. YPF-701]|nr:unnamed protein product [Pedinophyceae sp. YPF-701]
MRVYLDIALGDPGEYEDAVAAYKRTCDWLRQCGANYGLCYSDPGQVETEDERELLAESYAADPAWAGKGPCRLAEPAPLVAGRLEIELYADVPKAAENFRCLCTGERGLGKASRKPLHYKGCAFHRIVKGAMMQGGDVVRGDGSGGESIHGPKFNDEKEGLKRRHDAAGVLGMANSGKNSNTSQFYITFGAAPKFDGKHLVVGRVVAGLEVLERVNAEAASEGGEPRARVAVWDCGVL